VVGIVAACGGAMPTTTASFDSATGDYTNMISV
jgi:hypothetical protein